MGFGMPEGSDFSTPFNGDDNPLSGMLRQPGMFDEPAKTTTEITAKIGQPASQNPNPSSAFAMANFGTIPKSFDDWIADPNNVQKIPQRPLAPANTGKSFAGMALATALDSIGSALTGNRPTVGANWNSQIQAGREYDRNAPAMQQQANEAAYYGKYLPGENVKSEIQQRNMINPFYAKGQELKNEITQMWQSGQYSPQDFDRAVALKLEGNPYARLVSGDPYFLTQLKSLPQQKPSFKELGANGLPAPINYRGQQYGLTPTPGEPLEITAARQSAMDTYNQGRKAKLEDETTVANNAADRQSKGIAAAIQAANVGQENKTLNEGRAQALKHLNDMRAAQNQNELVQQLASSKSPTDQTSLAFKALGLDLPDGVHRINETELNAIRSQGGLGDKAYRAILNWKDGEQFAPDILQDIKNTATKIANSKIKNANDNLEDVNRVYGYKVEGAGPRGRLDEAAPALQVGQMVKLKNGKTVKVTAVHADGSFDY